MSFVPYFFHVLIVICIYVILGASLNLVMGYAGIINLGHVAFFGIGAYSSALLAKAGVPFVLAFFASGAVAGISGLVLFFATRKLKSDYLGLATLGFGFVVYSFMLNWTSVTNGPLGIAGIEKPSLLGLSFVSNEAYFLLVFTITVIVVLAIYAIVKSPFGRLMQAVRDDGVRVSVLGKNVAAVRCKSMVVSAFFAGIAGSLFAHYLSYIEPNSFILTEVVLILTIVVVGGLASLKGSILAAAIIVSVNESLRLLSLPSEIVGPGRQIIYAIILLGILMFRPRGIFGRVDLK